MVVMLLDQRYFAFSLGIALAAFALHGPLVGKLDHNGFRYILGSLVCPTVSATYFVLRPFNPYRGFAARWARMVELDHQNSDEKRLVELFESRLASHFTFQLTAKTAGILFTLMAVIAILERSSLNWSFSSYWFVPGILGGCIGTFVAIGSEYIVWGLRTWSGWPTH